MDQTPSVAPQKPHPIDSYLFLHSAKRCVLWLKSKDTKEEISNFQNEQKLTDTAVAKFIIVQYQQRGKKKWNLSVCRPEGEKEVAAFISG